MITKKQFLFSFRIFLLFSGELCNKRGKSMLSQIYDHTYLFNYATTLTIRKSM